MKIHKFDTLDSTNEYLKRNNKDYSPYDIIMAKDQTNGKARNGNYWTSLNGMALFTFYINNDMDINTALKIPIIAGYAVIKALNTINKNSYMFKWTNDVYLNDKKICGILLENLNNKIYIGIGINVNNKIPYELKNIATSMIEEYNKEYSIELIIEEVVKNFKNLIFELKNNGFEKILKEINAINYLKNRNINLKISNEIINAKIIRIHESGGIEALVDGLIKIYQIGEIVKERILINIDNINNIEKIPILQSKYYDIIGYSLERKNIDYVKKYKIKLYLINDIAEIKELKNKYKIKETYE